jgi:hypothetical protein
LVVVGWAQPCQHCTLEAKCADVEGGKVAHATKLHPPQPAVTAVTPQCGVSTERRVQARLEAAQVQGVPVRVKPGRV